MRIIIAEHFCARFFYLLYYIIIFFKGVVLFFRFLRIIKAKARDIGI